MKIHVLRHVPFIYYGHIESWVRKWGAELVETRFFQGGALNKQIEADLCIVLGGPMGVYETKEYPWLIEEKKYIQYAIKRGQKFLGICLGAQLLAEALGSTVKKAPQKEIGWFDVEKTAWLRKKPELLTDVPDSFKTFQWHGDCFSLPPDAEWFFTSSESPQQGFLWKKQILGTQFHPEMNESACESMLWRLGSQLTDLSSSVQSIEEIRQGYEHSPQNEDLMHALLDFMIEL